MVPAACPPSMFAARQRAPEHNLTDPLSTCDKWQIDNARGGVSCAGAYFVAPALAPAVASTLAWAPVCMLALACAPALSLTALSCAAAFIFEVSVWVAVAPSLTAVFVSFASAFTFALTDVPVVIDGVAVVVVVAGVVAGVVGA
jgi:hypothetical protein